MVQCSFTNYVVVDSSLLAVTLSSDIVPFGSMDVLDVQANIVLTHSEMRT